MSKVVVGMSGGVDSAVAAYLLKKAGYEVIGVTLRTWQAEDGGEGLCCDIDDARSVANKVGIRFVPVNCTSDFQKYVVDPFSEAYLSGLTPNPCVECNRYVKMEKLLYYAKVVGADHIATGHYASVIRLDNGRYTVKKASHAEKDQTYMLYRLSQEQLSALLMPLGDLSKSEVRQIAIVTDGTYADYIAKTAGADLPGEGNFVDESGKILGKHKGIIYYTVGQRKGLGISAKNPLYVKYIDPVKNEIVLGEENEVFYDKVECLDTNFLSIERPPAGSEFECRVKVRYHHRPQEAKVRITDVNSAVISFYEPVKAPAPGQSAVFYDNDECVIGGGIIKRSDQS